MKVIALQSGSNGNCAYVETEGVRLLFDAGISGVQMRTRLERHGRSVKGIAGVLISHDHHDHTCCMGVYHRKFGLPIHVTRQTLSAARSNCRLGRIEHVEHFEAGEIVQFGDVSVETIPTPHDGADGSVFVIDDGRHRLGILTDLGHVFEGLDAVIASLDAVLLESNYDDEMLANGGYPPHLKRRIQGPGGHISNLEAAQLLHRAGSERLRWVCLAHLSQENNCPQVALATHRQILGDRWPIMVASRYDATDVLEIE